MVTYHNNGERWYRREWSAVQWLRNWVIWCGGWEKANGLGWEIFNSRGKLKDIAPLSLFGHRFIHYGWGWQIRLGDRGILTRNTREGTLYLSSNGAPSQASAWFMGAPEEVTGAVPISRAA
jgi:hypothetical protein